MIFPFWCSILELVRTHFAACGVEEVPPRKFGKAAEPHRSKLQKNPEKNIGSNHILILGEENFLIMKTIEIKRFLGIMLSVAVLANVFFLSTTKVSALSCAFPKSIFIAAYEQGTFVDGFVVEHRGIGNWCDTRPVVNERSENLQNTFSIASQNLNQAVSSGVYQLSTRCLADRWDEWCAKDTALEQLSINSTELARYKSEWQQKERDGLRSATTQKWSVTAIIVAIAALALLWPWILVKVWPNLRKRLSLFLIIAILLQAPLALILQGMFIWSHGLWQAMASISSIVLGLSILVEIIFLIVRKIRSRNVIV